MAEDRWSRAQSQLALRSRRVRFGSASFLCRFTASRFYRILRRRCHDPFFKCNDGVIVRAIGVHDQGVVRSAQHRLRYRAHETPGCNLALDKWQRRQRYAEAFGRCAQL